MVAALLDWDGWRPRGIDEPHLEWLRGLAGGRAGGLGRQVRRLKDVPPEQTRAALEKMAESADVKALPPSVLHHLAGLPHVTKAREVRLFGGPRGSIPATSGSITTWGGRWEGEKP